MTVGYPREFTIFDCVLDTYARQMQINLFLLLTYPYICIIRSIVYMHDSQTISESSLNDKSAVTAARRVTWIGFSVNAILGVLKILAGIFGRSGAMIADGIHSLSDFVSDIIVLVFIGISRQKANDRYPYGHGKYETFATMLLAAVLAAVATLLFIESAEKTWGALHGEPLPSPGIIALVMATVSIFSKEWLYRMTRKVGERIRSAVVVANAWHHRSDALSSIATLVGVGGAICLGDQWRLLDPMAAMLVSSFIFIVAVRLGTPAVKELLEESLPRQTAEAIGRVISETEGVEAYHHFMSRRNGNNIILDFHIKVSPTITVVAGHDIADEVERRLRTRFGNQMIVNIHVEPYRGEKISVEGRCDD